MNQYRSNLTGMQVKSLLAPLNQQRVSSRSVDGRQQSYLQAYDVKAALIKMFGFGGFSCEVIESKIIDIREGGRQGQKKDGSMKAPEVWAQATTRLTIFGIGPSGQDAVYTETAIGTNSSSDVGSAADNAIKTAASDSMKRAAIFLGTQFGLSLYQNGATYDIVKVILNEDQRALIEALEAEREADRQRTADVLAKATTVEQQVVVEDVEAEAEAEHEAQVTAGVPEWTTS